MLAYTVLTVLSPGEQTSDVSDARDSKPTSCWCVQMPLHVTSVLTSCGLPPLLGGACSCCSLLAMSVMTYLHPEQHTSLETLHCWRGGRAARMQGIVLQNMCRRVHSHVATCLSWPHLSWGLLSATKPYSSRRTSLLLGP
jgi:hypothetical protein